MAMSMLLWKRVLKMGSQLLALLVSCLKIFARYLWWYDRLLSTSEPGPAPGLTSCLASVCPHPQWGARCPGLGPSPGALQLPWSWLGQWDGSWLPEPALTSLGSPCCFWPQGATGLCCSLTYFMLYHKIKIQPRFCLDQLPIFEVKD